MPNWKSVRNKFIPPDNERGQSLVILAFSFVSLIALLGLAIDLGMVYAERVQLKRAIDASVLSGVHELPSEEASAIKAIEYLNLNGYSLDDSNVLMRGCLRDIHNYYTAIGASCGSENCGESPTDYTQLVETGNDYYQYHPATFDENRRHTFWIDTGSYSEGASTCDEGSHTSDIPSDLGSANKLHITGTAKVDMNFMVLLGFRNIPVRDFSIAQSIDKLDVVIVVDESGSMGFDGICIGCWERNDRATGTQDWEDPEDTANDTPRYKRYWDYRANGVSYPLGYTYPTYHPTNPNDPFTGDILTHPEMARVCSRPTDTGFDETATAYISPGSGGIDNHYMILEAELYSTASTQPDPLLRAGGKGYWAMQRGELWYDDPAGRPSIAKSIDGKGAHMAYHPITAYNSNTLPPDGLCDEPSELAEGSGYCLPFGKYYSLADAKAGQAPYLQYHFRIYDGAGWADNPGQIHIWAKVHPNRSTLAGLPVGWWGGYYWEIGPNNGAYDHAYAEVVSNDCPTATCNPDTLTVFPQLGDNITQLPDMPHDEGGNGKWDATWPGVSVDANGFIAADDKYITEDGRFWRWVHVKTIDKPLTSPAEWEDTLYSLFIYAGSPGYAVDRIIITDDPEADPSQHRFQLS